MKRLAPGHGASAGHPAAEAIPKHERPRPHALGLSCPYPVDRARTLRPRGRYNIARLMEQYGDARLPELLDILAIVRRPARASMTGAKRCTAKIAGFEPRPEEHQASLSAEATATARILQTGTGTAHNTAISTAAITAVIFSLVDRSMASSESDANLSGRPIRGLGVTL